MKKLILAALMLAFASTGFASSISLQWDANTEKDIAGYKVYYSSEQGTLSAAKPQDNGKNTSAVLNGLDPTKGYFVAVTAYNTGGLESSFSNILSIPAFPAAPVNLRVNSIIIGGQ